MGSSSIAEVCLLLHPGLPVKGSTAENDLLALAHLSDDDEEMALPRPAHDLENAQYQTCSESFAPARLQRGDDKTGPYSRTQKENAASTDSRTTATRRMSVISSSACCGPELEQQSTEWKNVGPGKGEYEKVLTQQPKEQSSQFVAQQSQFGQGILWGLLLLLTLVLLVLVAMLSAFQSRAASNQSQGSTVSFDCQAGSPQGWSDAKKIWCCQYGGGLGCPSDFDCKSGVATWQETWSFTKMDYCCNTANVGCLQFDCAAGYSNWRADWSELKKEWCCSKQQKGCVETASPTLYDCTTHDLNQWSNAKKGWCCQHGQKGCDDHCIQQCTLKGVTAACKDRVSYAAMHTYVGQDKACALAYSLVQSECPSCNTCSFDKIPCTDTAATSTSEKPFV